MAIPLFLRSCFQVRTCVSDPFWEADFHRKEENLVLLRLQIEDNTAMGSRGHQDKLQPRHNLPRPILTGGPQEPPRWSIDEFLEEFMFIIGLRLCFHFWNELII